MNKVEQNYNTTEREALIMVFALHKCRHYLLSNKLVFYVDHMELIYFDAPPNSLMDSTTGPKGESNRRIMSWGTLPSLQHFGVERCVRAPKWGLGRLTRNSITHTNLHKPNNKLVSVWLKHFWCVDEPWANMDSEDSPWPELGGSHHLPPYSIFYA